MKFSLGLKRLRALLILLVVSGAWVTAHGQARPASGASAAEDPSAASSISSSLPRTVQPPATGDVMAGQARRSAELYHQLQEDVLKLARNFGQAAAGSQPIISRTTVG
jgi:hypothetical protein